MALNDVAGNIVYINPALTRLLGYTLENIPTLSAWFPLAYPDPDYRNWVMEEWEKRLAASRSARVPFEPMEVRVRKADGEYLLMQAAATDLVSESKGLHLVTLTDITLLKAQEESINDQRRRMNDILTGTNVGTWEWNIRTGETIFNERWAEIVGYTLEELQPVSIETWIGLGHPDDLGRSAELLNAHFRSETSFYECEARMRHKDGHWVWVLDRGKVSAWTDDGNPAFMSGTHQDISGRKRAEAELLQQKDELDDLYNRAPCGYHSVDADGVIQRINDTELGWLGLTREEVVGKRRITDFLTPESIKAFRTNFPKLKTSGRGDEYELGLVGKDGGTIPVLFSGSAIHDESGRFVRSRSVLVDFRRIREEQETLRNALAAAPVAVRIARLADNRVVMVNQAFCKLVRRSEAEAIGLDISKFYVDPRVLVDIQRRLHQGDPVLNELVELKFPHLPEAPHAWALTSCMVIDYLDEKSVLAWLYDISDREQLRLQLEQHRDQLEAQVRQRTLSLSIAKEAAEAADRLKATILKNISHEFRTPMNGIMGMLAIAQQRLDDPKHKDFIAKAETSARRLLATLTALIDLAAAESGHLTLAHVRFDVSDILADLHSQFAEAAKLKGLILTVGDVEIDVGPVVCRQFMGDPLRLEQILRELVGNAIKFSERGRIAIRTVVELDARGRPCLNCRVTDEGIGIRKDQQQSIFAPFQQVDGSATRTYGGNGIGLALCRRLAVQMGGTIGVFSVPGEGSSFTLRVPLEVASSGTQELAPEEALAALQSRHAGASVLVAEHDDILRAILCEYLDAAGLTVCGVGSGRDAIESARSARFELVLLDLDMPESAGVDVARAIRAMPQYAQTPMVAVTARPYAEHQEECLRAGVNGYIPVPFAPELLLNIVLEQLD